MNDDNTIAQKLTDFVFQHLKACQSNNMHPMPEEYLVFKKPDEMEKETEEICQRAFRKLEALKQEVGQPTLNHCGICGHDFGNHQMAGYADTEDGHPTHGWVMCKEKGCNCFRTWDLELAS